MHKLFRWTHQGLEAWRKIRKSLAHKDAQRLEDEYGVCTKLVSIEMNDLSHFNTMLTRWDAEIKRFEKLDPAYAIGKFQRQNIITNAMPDEIQQQIRAERSKTNSELTTTS